MIKKLEDYFVNFNYGWLDNFMAAVLIFILGLIGIKLILNFVRRATAKSRLEPIVANYLVICIKALLYVLLLIIVLSKLGVSVVSLVAVLSAAFAAVALALQDSLSNLAAGILIIVNKPFDKGDYIENSSLAGIVDEIHLFNCRLYTNDNKYIVVPNNSLVSSVITNYSYAENRRVDTVIQVAYDTDIAKAKAVLLEIAAKRREILAEPAPIAVISAHGDSAIEITYRVWCKNADYWTVYYYIMEEILLRFRQENIEIPYPQLDIHVIGAKEQE